MIDFDETEEGFTAEEKSYLESGGASATPSGEAATGEPGQQERQTPAGEKAATEPPKGTEGGQHKDRFVPYDAFHEERERRKSTEAEIAIMKERFSRADERLALMNELLGSDQPKPGQQEAPDPEKDIFAYVKHLGEQNKVLQERLANTDEQFQRQTADQQLISGYQEDARQFMAREPAFGPAYSHLVNVRAEELKVLGHTDPKQISAIIANEERALVANATKNNRSPAEMIFGLAKARGFTAQKAQTPATPQKTDAEKQLETIEKGLSASQTLSGAGGSASEGLTNAKIADMDEDEFDAYYSKLSKAQQKKLLGG